MARYQIILLYDGAAYQGFQRQLNAPTIQGSVEEALRALGWQGKTLLAAGRTDSGVHATGQVIAFDMNWRHDPQALQSALNANLPLDISAQSVQVTADDFHPRYEALSRHYRYQVYAAPERHALLERFAWRVWPAPEMELLRAAAKACIGEFDFAAFGTPPRPGGTTVRQITAAEWQLVGDPLTGQELLVFDVCANAFLYHMVRRLTYFGVMIGQGRYTIGDLERLIKTPPKNPIQGLAPSQGLFLAGVVYASANYENNLAE